VCLGQTLGIVASTHTHTYTHRVCISMHVLLHTHSVCVLWLLPLFTSVFHIHLYPKKGRKLTGYVCVGSHFVKDFKGLVLHFIEII